MTHIRFLYPLTIGVVIFIAFLIPASYYTHRDFKLCYDYHNNVNSSVISVNYTTQNKFGITECNKCADGGMYPSCTKNMKSGIDGPCHIYEFYDCQGKSFKWTDFNGFIHKEKYGRYSRYNYYKYCVAKKYKIYDITINLIYTLKSVEHNDTMKIMCNDPQNYNKCLHQIIQKYKVGNTVFIDISNDNKLIPDIHCRMSAKTIQMWTFCFITIIIIMCIRLLCYGKHEYNIYPV